jgi:hypothetical protein
MVKEGFGTWFREAYRAAGVEKSAHGHRKWFAMQLAERSVRPYSSPLTDMRITK